MKRVLNSDSLLLITLYGFANTDNISQIMITLCSQKVPMFKSPLPDVGLMVHPISAAVTSLKALTQTFQYNAHDS